MVLGFKISRSVEKPLHGCIVTLYVIAIRIQKPRNSNCSNPASYYHQKEYYAILVQAVCDSSCRFIFCSAICAGPTHDSADFTVSSFSTKLETNGLPYGYYIAADEACLCSEYVITSIPMVEFEPGSAEDGLTFTYQAIVWILNSPSKSHGNIVFTLETTEVLFVA